MRIHTYAGGGDVQTHPDVAPGAPLRECIVVEVDELVYRVGDEAALDIEQTVFALFGEEPGHVIRHHCREIAVTVSYAGQDQKFSVHPAEHVKRLQKRAAKAFQLDAATSADLAMRLPGATTDLVASYPIGAYVPRGTCAVTVDLIHVTRPQG
ncbi:hypothetical protein MPHO_51580 [Mycolicibacterium phocaicum]|uniref:Uncharacterized protein n=2 Tax=Mycolicibacterium phocaicum TaxID=319706 RepID=A0A7I7ZV69_9MYCO|nr:hypothetical protein C1S79_27890 [Mycolicibacterium phocaicum]BBZ58166.1 hypothetical protein MPHO_51580 [Mycolicibacterium phocaicum]